MSGAATSEGDFETESEFWNIRGGDGGEGGVLQVFEDSLKGGKWGKREFDQVVQITGSRC